MKVSKRPTTSSCGRLLHSLHGSGSTIFAPGFDCDSNSNFSRRGRGMASISLANVWSRWFDKTWLNIRAIIKAFINLYNHHVGTKVSAEKTRGPAKVLIQG